MVIDLEAIVITKNACTAPTLEMVIEQAAYIVVNQDCEIVLWGKYIVEQLMDVKELMTYFQSDFDTVHKAMQGYFRCTRDFRFVHNASDCLPWNVVKTTIENISANVAAKTYAKGALLEDAAFDGRIAFEDLNFCECPKYPYSPHDPADECRFFAMFIPPLNNSAFHRQQAYFEIQAVHLARSNVSEQPYVSDYANPAANVKI